MSALQVHPAHVVGITFPRKSYIQRIDSKTNNKQPEYANVIPHKFLCTYTCFTGVNFYKKVGF